MSNKETIQAIQAIVKANVEVGEFSMMLSEKGIKELANEFSLNSVDDFKCFFMDEVSMACVGLGFEKRFGCPRRKIIESALEV